MELGTLVALIVSIISCMGVVVAVLTYNRGRHHDTVKAAEERGAMRQRQQETEKDVDRAFKKINRVDDIVGELEKIAAAQAEAHKAIMARLDQLNALLMDHIQRGSP